MILAEKNDGKEENRIRGKNSSKQDAGNPFFAHPVPTLLVKGL